MSITPNYAPTGLISRDAVAMALLIKSKQLPSPGFTERQAVTERDIEMMQAAIFACSKLVENWAEVPPIPMVIHCPRCHVQHIDEATATWENPPHRSHQCQSCGTAWRPADVATAGVAVISTAGKSDDWQPGEPALVDLLGASLWQLLAHIGAISPTSTMRASELALEAQRFMSGTFTDSLRHGIQLVRHLATAEAADLTENTCMVPRQLVIEIAAAAERSLAPKVNVLARLDERTLLTIPVVQFSMAGDGSFSAQIDLSTFRKPTQSPLNTHLIAEDNELRDETAAILEQVAAEGLHQPRDLDVALDAIFETIGARYVTVRKAIDD